MQVDRFLEAVAADSACVLVHCGGGKGRAGTFAACCLAMWGTPPDLAADRPVMSAQEAVRLVRSLRPGSIETQEQEAFVQASPYTPAAVSWQNLKAAPCDPRHFSLGFSRSAGQAAVWAD